MERSWKHAVIAQLVCTIPSLPCTDWRRQEKPWPR